MRIAVLTGARHFEIQDAPVPAIRADEVLVRVSACGVCTSEFAAWEGVGEPAYPLHLGHEVSGTVVETGAATEGLAPGDPVGVWVTSHGFAEYVAVKAAYCRPAGEVPLDTVLAEPLACAANAVEAPTSGSVTTWSWSGPASWATWCSCWSGSAGPGRSSSPTPGRTRSSARRRWEPTGSSTSRRSRWPMSCAT